MSPSCPRTSKRKSTNTNTRLLPACLLCAILFLVLTAATTQRAQAQQLIYESAQIIDANFFVHTVQFAYQGDQLKFAVFQKHYADPTTKCQVVHSIRNEISTPLSATITLNDTKQRDLLKEGGIYRVQCGTVEKVETLKFKPSELKEFLKEATANNTTITLEDFQAHLRRKNV